MSVYSQRSATSKGSKRVAKDSQVDETLFGNKKPGTATSGDRRKQEEIYQVTQEIKKGELKNPNAIIIPHSELMRIKNTAVITTKEEQIQQKRIAEEQAEKQLAAAKARKQKMLDIEAEKKKYIAPSESELADQHKKEISQNRAQKLLNEQRDEVKHMNQMMNYAKTVTIRDKQLEEKKEIIEHKKNEEKRKDLMMEVERLKKVKFYEEQERARKDEQRQKALLVVDQIKEREMERLREQEEKEREGQEIVRAIKQNQIDEQTANMKKKANQKSRNDEIYDANQKAITSKQKKIEEELAEEEKIVRYNIEKAQKEAEHLGEIKRIKDEKEREVQRLREKQEKQSDRQAELDYLRAKRAVEQADREAREKERLEAEKRARMNAEMMDARQIQALEKEIRLQEQAKAERDEFQRVKIQQKAERDFELRTEHEKKDLVYQHAEQLKKQIALNEEKIKQDKRQYLEEGKKIKDKLAAEKRILEHIKTEKMTELNSQGIPDKYQTELAKKKIIV